MWNYIVMSDICCRYHAMYQLESFAPGIGGSVVVAASGNDYIARPIRTYVVSGRDKMLYKV